MGHRRAAAIVVVVAVLIGAAASTARAEEADRDGDGMPDGWEKSHGLDPDDPSDASEDPDSDELVNRDEYFYDGDPQVADTDGDGLKDGPEVYQWQSGVREPNRIVGRVRATGRCRTGDGDCPPRYLFAIEVTLQDPDGETVAKRHTLANGRFTFGDVEPGTYRVSARSVAGTRAPEPRTVEVTEDQDEPARAPVRMRDVNGPGVVGQAIQAPTCGAQRKGEDCLAPLPDAPIVVKDLRGEVVARTETGEDGYYAFELLPGDYKLVAKRIDGGQFPHPPRRKLFTVSDDDRGPRVIGSPYDTGIR